MANGWKKRGRAEVLGCKTAIKQMMAQGHTLTYIHRVLTDKGSITIKYTSFYEWVVKKGIINDDAAANDERSLGASRKSLNDKIDRLLGYVESGVLLNRPQNVKTQIPDDKKKPGNDADRTDEKNTSLKEEAERLREAFGDRGKRNK